MKRLTLIRHAKSSWDDPDLPDHDRPLAPRGKSDAKLIADFLLEKELSLGYRMSSGAKRARKTAKIISKKMHLDPDAIYINDDLYVFGGEGNDLLDIVANVSDTHDIVTIFAHNETLRRLVLRLSQGQISEFPTCAVASFVYDITSWHEIAEEPFPQLDLFICPSLLR